MGKQQTAPFFHAKRKDKGRVGNSKPRLRQNFAGEVIAQRENDHNQEPEKSRGDEDPGEARAVAHVHEIEQHQQRFARCNREREVNIQPAGVVKSHVDGDQRQHQQGDEDENVDFLGNNNVLCHISYVN